MKITIRGLDYTLALDAARPLTIERTLNEQTQCRFGLAMQANEELSAPVRNDAVAITADDGTLLFTGEVAGIPLPEYVGAGFQGPLYSLAIVAMSSVPPVDQSEGLAYRMLNGKLSLAPVASVVHALDETGDRFNPANLTLAPSVDRWPVNDVTLCGELEPVAYVTEYFHGDGITSIFYLADEPYSPPSSGTTIIRELFDGPEIDSRQWVDTADPGCFALAGGGLAIRGGNGIDGQTALSFADAVEMGGALLLEALGLSLTTGSAGIVAGFFDSGIDSADCTAGFQVTAQAITGILKIQPLVQGTPAGTAFTANASNRYSLRLRVHSPECHRQLAIYRAYSDGGAMAAGGEWNLSQGKLQFEIQEFVNGVGGMPVTLYDGAVAGLPGACVVVAASSLNLVGSLRAIHLTNIGSVWVVSTPSGGGAYTRRLGNPVEAGECQLQSGGKLQFQPGSVPLVGELVSVSYRTRGRAVGRAVNAGSSAGSSWTGSVIEPQARCSADCRNAAVVTAATAAEDSSVLRGTYKGTNFEFDSDVWPGDALLLNAPSANLDAQVVARKVKVSYNANLPDLIDYEIAFANDWADDLAIKRSSTVPDDAWLSVFATPTVLPNLSGLTVTTLNGSTVAINTGTAPLAGGGFEVRRRDFEFMPGTDPGLVTRSALPNLTFSRETANDRFYIRMYDGATPPNYSECSTALFINLPLGS